ncbi:hypothetical protein [Sphingopyxis sp. MSC1_008]|jgi:hypothetical protein|uniref:hypothetical protein n=1 Tax=Sphingopyxis sp. MSC1_008 TaxID=2909265 RepID=UPI0020BE4124|nr:hypothetical protein [Sphingopyxis sp. MSC1_008]
MISRNRWHIGAAIVAFVSAAIGMIELNESRDLSKDWHGPAWLLTGLIWLHIAYRRPRDEP